MEHLSAQVPGLQTSAWKSHRRPPAADLGSNLRIILRTYVDLRGKAVPSESLRTIGMTVNAP